MQSSVLIALVVILILIIVVCGGTAWSNQKCYQTMNQYKKSKPMKQGTQRYQPCSKNDCLGSDVCCKYSDQKICLPTQYASDGGQKCPYDMTQYVGSGKSIGKSGCTPNYIPDENTRNKFVEMGYSGGTCPWTGSPTGGQCVNSNNCVGTGVCCENDSGVKTCQPRRHVTYKDGSTGYHCPCGFKKQHCGGSRCPKVKNYGCAPSTCGGCKIENDYLRCQTCTKARGGYDMDVSLNLSDCSDDIANCDGKLTCGKCPGDKKPSTWSKVGGALGKGVSFVGELGGAYHKGRYGF